MFINDDNPEEVEGQKNICGWDMAVMLAGRSVAFHPTNIALSRFSTGCWRYLA
jgi:hypothetical protein